MARTRRTRNAERILNIERRNADRATIAERILDTGDASLLDVVDNALTKGVVLSGHLTLALANVDLVYARLSVLLCAADKVLPDEPSDFLQRRRHRARRRPPSLGRVAARPDKPVLASGPRPRTAKARQARG